MLNNRLVCCAFLVISAVFVAAETCKCSNNTTSVIQGLASVLSTNENDDAPPLILRLNDFLRDSDDRKALTELGIKVIRWIMPRCDFIFTALSDLLHWIMGQILGLAFRLVLKTPPPLIVCICLVGKWAHDLRTGTIYSDDELKERNPLDIRLQIMFTGTKCAIPSSLANRPCSSFPLHELVETLNDCMGTAYPINKPGLIPQLQAAIDNQDDFGTMYSRLRRRWSEDLTKVDDRLARYAAEDKAMRENALDRTMNRIVCPEIPARRVWDLYSNRVVLWWVNQPSRSLIGVSHSWMHEGLRHNIYTPINGNAWPVPIPIDTTLERVRIELLNKGAEYVWLDVLCLRQASSDPASEAARAEEWELDVPTIGSVYRNSARIAHYFSGLGRPFEIGDMENERHWFNRAWTLQEIRQDNITLGITTRSPVIYDNDGKLLSKVDSHADAFVQRLKNMLALAKRRTDKDLNLFDALDIMRQRSAVNEVDRVAGLEYLLQPTFIPVYKTSQDAEDAWSQLVKSMDSVHRAQVLFLYPGPGLRDTEDITSWIPTWKHLMKDRNAVFPHADLSGLKPVIYIEYANVYRTHGYLLENCRIQGLQAQDHPGSTRRGTMSLRGLDMKTYSFSVVADHQYSIPEESCVMVGNASLENWIVGRFLESGRLQKIAVLKIEFEMPDYDQSDRKLQLLQRISQSEAFRKRYLGKWTDVDLV